MSNDIAIKVEGVSKTFILPHEKHTSIKGAFINFYKRRKGYEKQQVLDNISFEIKKGEFFGIVGRNGSGKSTLLKLLAGIYAPDEGNIQINGKLTPFIELGVGFNPELSGRENVFLNGALLGFNRKEMEALYDEIVEFAELERFMDQKLKNYSSGMQVRLAFSIAIRANTDILVLDEVLAVGDEAFQKKCYDYFSELRKQNKTVVLVTHSMEAVRQFCTNAILLEGGKIKKSNSDVNDIANEYSKLFIDANSNTAFKENNKKRFGTGDIVFERIIHKLTEDLLLIDMVIKNTGSRNIEGVDIGVDIYNDGRVVTGAHYQRDFSQGITLKAGSSKGVRLEISNIFERHRYDVSMNIKVSNGSSICDKIDDAFTFTNSYGRSKFYLINPNAKFKI